MPSEQNDMPGVNFDVDTATIKGPKGEVHYIRIPLDLPPPTRWW